MPITPKTGSLFHAETQSKHAVPATAKDALVKSALSLFVRNGVDGTSIRDIAKGTAFTNAALFKHYESKEALAIALFEMCYDDLANTVAAPIPDAPFPDRIRIVISRYLGFMDHNLDASLFVQDNLRRYWPKLPKNPSRISLLGHMRGIIVQGKQAGWVAVDKDDQLLVAAIIGLLGQFARMIYFQEFKAPAIDHAPHVSRLVNDVCREQR